MNLKELLAKLAKDPASLTEEEKAFLYEHQSEISDEEKTAAGEALTDLIEEGDTIKGLSDMFDKKLDKLADGLVSKFKSKMRSARAGVLEGDEKSQLNKEDGEKTREFFKMVFQGADRASMKAAGYLDNSTEATAGALVPPGFLAEVLRIAEKQYGLARRDMRYLPFSGPGNSRKIPALSASVAVSWTGQGNKKSSTKPSFTLVEQTMKKLAAIVPMTDELLEDSAINLPQLLAELFAEAVSKEEDLQFFNGTGSPWTGILHNTSVNVVTLTSTSIANVTPNDLLDMIDATPSGALAGSKFYMNRSIFSVLRKLRADSGDGVYIVQSPTDPSKLTMWGYPVELSDALPGLGDNAADSPFVLFGNLSIAAIFGDKQQLRVKLLDQATVSGAEESSPSDINLAEQDMTALRIVERVGYVLAVPKAVTVLKTAESSS